MIWSLYFSVTCIPFRAAKFPNMGFSHCTGVHHRVTDPYFPMLPSVLAVANVAGVHDRRTQIPAEVILCTHAQGCSACYGGTPTEGATPDAKAHLTELHRGFLAVVVRAKAPCIYPDRPVAEKQTCDALRSTRPIYPHLSFSVFLSPSLSLHLGLYMPHSHSIPQKSGVGSATVLMSLAHRLPSMTCNGLARQYAGGTSASNSCNSPDAAPYQGA